MFRLMFVNDTALENASLDTAVQALKGAAQGCLFQNIISQTNRTKQITKKEEEAENLQTI